MIESRPDILAIRFAQVDKDLADLRETVAIHTARFAQLEHQMETGFRELKAEVADIKRILEECLPRP